MVDTKDCVMDASWWNVDFASAMMIVDFVQHGCVCSLEANHNMRLKWVGEDANTCSKQTRKMCGKRLPEMRQCGNNIFRVRKYFRDTETCGGLC